MNAPAHHLSLVCIDVCEWRRQIRGRALLKEKVVAISTSTKEGTAKGKGFDNLRENELEELIGVVARLLELRVRSQYSVRARNSNIFRSSPSKSD